MWNSDDHFKNGYMGRLAGPNAHDAGWDTARVPALRSHGEVWMGLPFWSHYLGHVWPSRLSASRPNWVQAVTFHR